MDLSAQERAFAAEVDRYRAAAGVTQQWLADRVGLTRPKISEVCSGRYLLSRQTLDALIIALAMDRERAVELWRAACVARRERRRADKLAQHPAPEGWTALPVLPAEVRSLLHAQVEAATEMPYRLPGARSTSLATVYVRQELASAVEQPQQDQPRPQPVLDERGVLVLPAAPTPRLTVRPPSRAVRKALDEHDHLVVTGGPGQGKSTLSLRLAAEIATRWLRPDEDGVIPLAEPVVSLRLTARELATRLDMPFPQALADSIRAEYGSLLRSEITAGLLNHRVTGCRWLLLIDGLDEVANGIEQERLVKALAMWAVDAPCRVVLTTRPIEGAVLAPMQRAAAVRYELQPFNDEAFRRFAEHWFAPEGAQTADRFLHQIRQAHLDELVRVPLLATIAAIIFEQHQDHPLPDNRYELYEEYLLYLRSARNLPTGPFEHLRGGLLEHLGQVRLEADTSLMGAAHDWVTEHSHPGDLPVGWQEGVSTFLTSVGPMLPRGGDLQFMHHSFAEHLAATGKARQLPEKFDPQDAAFRHLLHAARQKERGRLARAVLLHYTRLHPTQADNLVRCLHAGTAEEQLIAARLLAQHAPASPDVVEAFLGTARAWATTSMYTAGEILSRACRVVHHPGLVPWLIDLLREHTLPWRSRVQAALALATRVRGPHVKEATALLCTVVEDTEVPTADRLTAAEGLTECGAPDRATAERGLRALLADPTASPDRRRGAAVVLAGLGPQGRDHAAQALLVRLDDPTAPMTDLVESAAGLVDIGAEFYERSVQAFRQVLHSPARMSMERRDAAVGLAALGPDHLSEAIAVLTTLVTNRRLDYSDRAQAAETLARMGPRYRSMAAGYLQDMLTEPASDVFDQQQQQRLCAEALAGLGTEFHPIAAEHLRKIIKHPQAHRYMPFSAVQALADLGPDFHAEAATEFLRLADDPLTHGHDCAAALSGLVELGPPHRADAVQRLRAILNDRNAEPDTRHWAASRLVDLGTEFHAEVGEALSEIVHTCADPATIVNACGTLMMLGDRFHELFTDALLVVLGSPSVAVSKLGMLATIFTDSNSTIQQLATDALENVLTDPTRGDWARLQAATHFVRLGSHYHRIGVDTVLRLLRQDGGPQFPINLAVNGMESDGTAARTEIAEALCDLLTAPESGPLRTWGVVCALIGLGFDDRPEVVSALRVVAGDATVYGFTRCAAAVHLTELAAEHRPFALAVVHDIATTTVEPLSWREAMLSLNRLDEDAAPPIQAVLADPDTGRQIREAAAVLLPELRPNLTNEAIGELREQAADGYLNFWQLTDVLTSLAALDETTRNDAIAFHAAVVNDEHTPADMRCYAAKQLVHLDRTQWTIAVATVRRLLVDPRTKPAGQQYAANQLHDLRALRSEEAARLAVAVAHHPEARPETRADITKWWHLPGPTRVALRAELLADHAVPPSARVPNVILLDDSPLVAETEVAFRDVLTAVEFGRSERVQAATQLATLRPTLVADAVCALRDLSVGADEAASEARMALANLGGPWRHEAVADASRMVADESLSPRQRWRATTVVLAHQLKPSAGVLDFLRTTVSNERVSERRRIDALFALRRTDGLGPLRTIRDDEHVTPASRSYAADLLADYEVEDRAAAAQLLSDIAADPTARPALRWRAAEDLVKFGVPGRDRSVDALSDIMTDENLPATARAQAARVLAEIRPSRFTQALTVLRNLSSIDHPLRRTRVLLALGSLDTAEAVPSIRAMADDRALGPVVRLRCAEALVELRRDQREAASIVTRELMHDESVLPHVRSRAARDLARWSELCRNEAREMLQVLHNTTKQGSAVSAL